MNAQYVFKLPGNQWDRQLAAIAATGVGVVREDAFWSRVEPQPPRNGTHHYNWTAPDAIASALARNGLRWYPILDYSTTWDGTLSGPKGWKSAPADPTEFAAYAAAFAGRYGTGGSFWADNPSLPMLPVQTYEVWNEPNLSDFWPETRGAADRYGELLAATAPALRAADPAGRVVVGGLSPTGLGEFLDEVEARQPGLIATMDAVGFHPYGTTFADTGARVRVLREWLDRNGAGEVPIEVTETGWATPPLPEENRATRMGDLVLGLTQSSCDISRIIPYTWLTFEGDNPNPENRFGIANSDGTLKPTGLAFITAMESVLAGQALTMADPCTGLSDDASHSADSPAPELEISPPVPVTESAVPDPPDGASPSTPEAGLESLPEIETQDENDDEDEGKAESDPPGFGSNPFSVAAGGGLVNAAPGGDTTAAGMDIPHAAIKVTRRPHVVAVRLICPRTCRASVRLSRAAGRPIGHGARPQLARRHRALLTLPASGRGEITVRAMVRMSGSKPQLLVRRVR